MEDLRKFLERSDIDLDEISSDSDVSFESKSNGEEQPSSGAATKSKRKKCGEGRSQRLPTRRPDPNVYNRNALLARENRRKKKAHLEAIEKELEEARNANRTLLKALKKQHKISQRLDREKQYFKNILANHTEINSLVNTLNFRKSSYNTTCISPESSAHSHNYHSSSRSSSYEPEVLTSSTFQNSENDYEPTTAYNDTWNELLEENCFGFNPPKSPATPTDVIADEGARVVNDDHSYVKDCGNTATIPVQSSTLDNTGICLHIAGGKVSLEFCPSCHWNASRTPPTQLLQDECDSTQQLQNV